MWLATSLSAYSAAQVALGQACHSVVGGVWSLALGVLLDDKECGMVRQQVSPSPATLISNCFAFIVVMHSY